MEAKNKYMRPGKYNFLCPQGATFTKQLSWLIDSTPVNLTGYSAKMQVRETASSNTVVIELSTDNGRITLGGAAGSIALEISHTDTSALAPKTYLYDIELTSAGNQVTRLLEGKFTVTAEVTR